MATTPDRPGTRVGARRSIVVPSPSCPTVLAPKAHTVPSRSRTRLCSKPAATADAVAIATRPGRVRRPATPGSPRAPSAFTPQLHTSPFEVNARLCCPPPAMPATSVSEPTRTGVDRLVVVPSPSAPPTFQPQPHAVPLVAIANAWLNAPAMDCPFARIGGNPATCTGLRLASTVEIPSWPWASLPHERTVPSACSARECDSPPAAIGVAAWIGATQAIATRIAIPLEDFTSSSECLPHDGDAAAVGELHRRG